VTEGDVAMRLNYSLEPWETEQGFVLTCQTVAKPGCGRVVVDYDQM
jgi:ring-1,2-phenylacetyl-CoA epoxidase subunit PaaE